MTRISLKEAYDNRDVIAQIAKINDVIEDLPNPDLTNVVLKTGNQVIDGVKTFNDQIVAAGGVDFSGDLEVQGDLQVDGDIIQVGAAYETHAQQIYTTNDYIVTRDGAVSGIPAGQYSGIHVEKYNGVDDVRMVVDNSGIMRVGDINDEKPLAVRDEAADMTSGALVKWDGVNQKLITSSANVGDDTHPVKIVDGAPVAVTGPVLTGSFTSGTVAPDTTNATLQNVAEPMKYYRIGNLASVSYSLSIVSNADTTVTYRDVPISVAGACPKGVNTMYPQNATVCSVDGTTSGSFPFVYVSGDGTLHLFIRGEAMANKVIVGSITYICTD